MQTTEHHITEESPEATPLMDAENRLAHCASELETGIMTKREREAYLEARKAYERVLLETAEHIYAREQEQGTGKFAALAKVRNELLMSKKRILSSEENETREDDWMSRYQERYHKTSKCARVLGKVAVGTAVVGGALVAGQFASGMENWVGDLMRENSGRSAAFKTTGVFAMLQVSRSIWQNFVLPKVFKGAMQGLDRGFARYEKLHDPEVLERIQEAKTPEERKTIRDGVLHESEIRRTGDSLNSEIGNCVVAGDPDAYQEIYGKPILENMVEALRDGLDERYRQTVEDIDAKKKNWRRGIGGAALRFATTWLLPSSVRSTANTVIGSTSDGVSKAVSKTMRKRRRGRVEA